MVDTARALDKYAKMGRKTLEGWFSRIDAELFNAILSYQNAAGIKGSTAEIGVHHGKSFIPLCLALKSGERAMCADLFENQQENIDQSGRGDYSVLMRNLAQAEIPTESVEVFKGSSLALSAETILERVGPIRFFSVDGGHRYDIVMNDLSIALEAGLPEVVIALDDFLHKEWPEVTIACVDWFKSNDGKLAPITLSNGKLYVCRAAHLDQYKNVIAKNPFLEFNFHKQIDLLEFKVPLIDGSPKNSIGKTKDYARLYHPEIFDMFRHAKRTASSWF